MLKTFSITDTGIKRKMNQDYVYTCEQPVGNLPNLFLVADGMGGHNAGDRASRVAVETICAHVATNMQEHSPARILQSAIREANGVVHRQALDNPDYEGMGTTVVAATCIGKFLEVANVGDSRLYLMRDDKMIQVTRDHSWVEEMVREGSLDPEEARNHPKKNIITRAVGADAAVEVDTFQIEMKPKDEILMCSDGLSNMLEDEEIRMILCGARDIVEKAQELVEAANRNGGRDNITVLLIEPGL